MSKEGSMQASGLSWERHCSGGPPGPPRHLRPRGFDPGVIGALRLLVGGGAMLILVMLQSGFMQLKGWPLKTTLPPQFLPHVTSLLFFRCRQNRGGRRHDRWYRQRSGDRRDSWLAVSRRTSEKGLVCCYLSGHDRLYCPDFSERWRCRD